MMMKHIVEYHSFEFVGESLHSKEPLIGTYLKRKIFLDSFYRWLKQKEPSWYIVANDHFSKIMQDKEAIFRTIEKNHDDVRKVISKKLKLSDFPLLRISKYTNCMKNDNIALEYLYISPYKPEKQPLLYYENPRHGEERRDEFCEIWDEIGLRLYHTLHTEPKIAFIFWNGKQIDLPDNLLDSFWNPKKPFHFEEDFLHTYFNKIYVLLNQLIMERLEKFYSKSLEQMENSNMDPILYFDSICYKNKQYMKKFLANLYKGNYKSQWNLDLTLDRISKIKYLASNLYQIIRELRKKDQRWKTDLSAEMGELGF